MMAYNPNCLSEITAAVGRDLNKEDLDNISTMAEELMARIEKEKTIRSGMAHDDLIRAAADDYAADMIGRAKIHKRTQAIQLRRRLERLDWINNSRLKKRPDIAVSSILVGVNNDDIGSRLSAAAEQNYLREHYLSGFTYDVENLGPEHWKLFINGELDRDITKALWLRHTAPDSVEYNGIIKQARDVAEVIDKWQEITRIHANEAGAWIKRRPDYVVAQSHRADKIFAAGEEQWISDVKDALDPETFGGKDPIEYLKVAYKNLASGVHIKNSARSNVSGTSNIARRMSEDRILIFKNADAWFDYNAKYGMGNLREALLHGFEMRAHGTGLMRVLGPNPEDNLNRIINELLKSTKDPAAVRKLAQAAKSTIQHQIDTLTGADKMTVNHTVAKSFSAARGVQRMSKLGSSLFAQISDVGFYGGEHKYQGESFLSGIAESLGNIVRNYNSAEMKDMLGGIAVWSDNVIGDIAHRFSIADDDLPGVLSKAQRLFFKWNGMTWWTDAQRRGAVASMAWRLARYSNKNWGQLNPDYRRVLSMYGIQEADWNIIRASKQKFADKRAYITPELISDESVARKVHSYLIDRSKSYVIMPDQKTQAFMRRSTRPGTAEGELLRSIGELKAFPIAASDRALGREIFGRGADVGASGFESLSNALRNGNGEMLGLANLILATTLFGYMSMTAKDLLKGKEPRDPFNAKTFVAAALQGGGGAIYGDFLFGQVRTRFGQGFLTTIAGPTLGTIQDLADLWGRAREGDDAAAQTFKVALQNTPFINLFYVRPVLDYLILWQIQEALNPGSLKRIERLIERENAQSFWMRPSQMVQ